MKLGVIASHLVMRNDIRNMIHHMNDHFELVVFVRADEKKYLEGDFEFRQLDYSLRNIWNKICAKVFRYFGQIPNSKESFLSSERVLALKNNKGWRGNLDIWTRLVLPNLMSYDDYLMLLRGDYYNIDDIDTFFSFTPHNEDVLLSQILNAQKQIYTYLYSWDHPAKFSKILKNKAYYFTWNEGLKGDLIKLHGVTAENIKAIGISQFADITKIKKLVASRKGEVIGKKFFYYVASWGYNKLALQEVALIKYLALTIENLDPSLQLVFRPYPMLENWDCYKELKEFSNVVFDEFQQAGKGESIFTESDIEHKFSMISDSVGIIHCGTTIGLEACFFDKPLIYMNLQNLDYGVKDNDHVHIKKGWQKHHLEKYFLNNNYDNVVLKKEKLREVLKRCVDKDRSLLKYNDSIQKEFPFRTINQIVDSICSEIMKVR